MKNKHYTHRRLLMIIDVIGESDFRKLTRINTHYLCKHNMEYLGVGRIIDRSINGGTRIYVFDLYFLKELSIIQKCKHYFLNFCAATLRYAGFKPSPIIITHYA